MDRSVSVPMTLKGGTRGVKFFRDLLNNARDLERPNSAGGDGHISWGQPRPQCKGRGLPASQFLGFTYIYAYTLCRRTTKFKVVTHVWRGLVLGVSYAPVPKGRSPSAPQFLGSSLLYTLFKEERPNWT